MRKYNVFSLYVVEKDNHKFICEKLSRKEYKEILTKEKLVLEKNDKITLLTDYYDRLEIVTYKAGKMLTRFMLTKKDILLKYIEINASIIDKKSDNFIEKQQEEPAGLTSLSKEYPEFAKKEVLKKSKSTGILDKNGDVMPPYQKVFAQITDNPKELSKK